MRQALTLRKEAPEGEFSPLVRNFLAQARRGVLRSESNTAIVSLDEAVIALNE
jgi:hypothetical protein